MKRQMNQKVTLRRANTIGNWAVIVLAPFALLWLAWGCAAASPSVRQAIQGDGTIESENNALKVELARLDARLDVQNTVGGDQRVNDPVIGWLAVVMTPLSFIVYTLANRSNRFQRLKHGRRFIGCEKQGEWAMHPKTGETREFQTRDDAETWGWTISLKHKPRLRCKTCFGSGHTMRNGQGEYVPCICTQ